MSAPITKGTRKGGVVRRLLLTGAALALFALGAVAEEPGTSRALIVVGLPGDAEHEKLFAETAGQWRTWLVDRLGFRAADVRVLFGRSGAEGLTKQPATRKEIEREAAALKESLRPRDRLWVFFLGHGDYDGERAAFHLSGPDLHGDELGKLFADVKCREQVFWMTGSAAGWFVKPLSAKGRIVIAATAADAEYNETEFPQALAAVSKLAVADLDENKDGKVSVLEVYRRTLKEVEARFAADKRVPTENAQIDDNAGGALAAKTYLPLRKTE